MLENVFWTFHLTRFLTIWDRCSDIFIWSFVWHAYCRFRSATLCKGYRGLMSGVRQYADVLAEAKPIRKASHTQMYTDTYTKDAHKHKRTRMHVHKLRTPTRTQTYGGAWIWPVLEWDCSGRTNGNVSWKAPARWHSVARGWRINAFRFTELGIPAHLAASPGAQSLESEPATSQGREGLAIQIIPKNIFMQMYESIVWICAKKCNEFNKYTPTHAPTHTYNHTYIYIYIHIICSFSFTSFRESFFVEGDAGVWKLSSHHPRMLEQFGYRLC